MKRAGISAEFGRSSGFVANAVTHSGTNRLAGGLRFEAIPTAWIAKANQLVSNPTDRYVTSGAIGGPILMNRIFFYASASGPPRDHRRSPQQLRRAARPQGARRRRCSARSPRRRRTRTSSTAPTVIVPARREYGNIGINDSPALGTHSEGTNRVANGSWNWFPDSRTAVEVKYLRLDQPDETVAVTDLGFLPTFDINNLAAMGNFFDPKLNARVGGASKRWSSQSYDRTEVKGSVSRFLDFAKAQHQIKAGFGWEDTTEDLTRLSNGWGTLSLVQNNTQIQARYYPVQPSQLSKSRTYTHVRAGRHHDHAAPGRQRRPAADARRVRAAARLEEHLPEVRLRRRNPAAHRRQLQPAQGRGRQDLRQLRQLHQPGAEEQRAFARAEEPVS